MKRTIAFIALVSLMSAAFFSGCSNPEASPSLVQVSLGASSDVPSSLSASRAVTGGQALETIASYNVVFRKIEIGNSEKDKFTLWESANGETKNVALPVSFADVMEVEEGTYNYIRLTIGETLTASGSLTDPATGVVYSGTGTCVLDSTQFLWGTNIANEAGEITIQNPIEIEDGTALNFHFAIAGTIAYQSGGEADPVFSVTKPVLTLSGE